MTAKENLLTIIKSPWIIALLLLGLFFATSSYKYGWDDQHLEIPLLKHLIDHELYAGDYYVESLAKNFSSYFYPILAKLITVEQIPNVYFTLYIISRYFLFFWVYKIWQLIAKDSVKAFCCSAIFILIVRVPEFLYRTFSHQEFALAIIFAGIYYFFKERYVLAALILGLAANFHALYSLFPMYYLGLYLLFSVKEKGFKPLILSCVSFLAFSSPFVVWTLSNRLSVNAAHIDHSSTDWISLFILACPQNFIFPEHPLMPFKELIGNFNVFISATKSYLFLIVLYWVNFFFNKPFRENKKAVVFSFGAFSLILLCLIFTYFYHVRLMIDLNLARNTQFLLFLLIGYTALLILDTVEQKSIVAGTLIAMLFVLFKLGDLAGLYASGVMFFSYCVYQSLKAENRMVKNFLSLISLACGVWFAQKLYASVMAIDMGEATRNSLILVFILLAVNGLLYCWIKNQKFRKLSLYLFLIIPLSVVFVQFSQYKKLRVAFEETGGGFWQLQRNWEDMQRYVQKNTPKDAMLLVPYNLEMGGFRILSERKIICSYRDCGIIGFDYNATVEWQRRVKDIEAYKFMMDASPMGAIQNAVTKYGADYIVFMNYAAPKQDNALLTKLYANSVFTLFKVRK